MLTSVLTLRSAELAYCSMNPETASLLVFWVAAVFGIPYSSWTQVGVILVLQDDGAVASADTLPEEIGFKGEEIIGKPTRAPGKLHDLKSQYKEKQNSGVAAYVMVG